MSETTKMPMEAEPPRLRSLNNGAWYWIDKKILFVYGNTLKASGIAVYNVLAAYSNGKTQACFPAQARIAQICRVSNRTVIRKIKLLQDLGLIRTERKRKGLTYYLLEPQVGDKYFVTCDKSYRRHVTKIHTNKKNQTRINNENTSLSDLNNFKPDSREELLAKDLAIFLGDPTGFPFYLAKAKAFPEELLRAILSEIKQLPEIEIKKSRGALFNHLLQKHVQKTEHHPGD